MANDSAWTWGYFFAAHDKAAVQHLFGQRPQSLSCYRVDEVIPIRGQTGAAITPGAGVVRVEAATRLPAPVETSSPTLLFQGVPQHLQYTSGAQRADLNQRSRAELPAGADTIAVIIPIRKTAAWWALPLDERIAHFQARGNEPGHTAIGAPYVERIYRKLYHARYAVETTDHDFITYFEFERARAGDFRALLHQLRDPHLNSEWRFVDREYEIWMTKFA